jgi:hypothetical protein
LNEPPILHNRCGEFKKGFSPKLGWSHYRALMRVDSEDELKREIEREILMVREEMAKYGQN